ncbi:MAG TPA: hypothetical protein VK781_07085 [Solirubrobacteraceae bacterium]|jgi:hypothetical protein|nr:hypothetical protein [Solirubrobacteraceae bacterium]
MRRIRSHIPLIAALAAICLAGQTVAIGTALAASSPPVDKAALNKAVQEALAKAQAEKGAGGQSAAGSASSGGVSGSSESFSKLTQGGGEEETATQTTPTTAATTTASSGLSTNVLVPIFILGGLLLAGIAFFIVRDARSVAPAGDGLGNAGSSRDRAARQRKRRAKAKAARQQRKRNR